MAAGSQGSTRDELLSFLRSHSSDHLNTFCSQLVSAVLSDAHFACLMSMECGLINRFPFPVLLNNLWPLITLYKATLTSLDFTKVDQVCHEVNSWVERETHGLKKIYSDIVVFC
ncbi:hypothetical protein P8452_22792 [Trifolium repens]|nr:hypothetical protein P8452_22792 [Trifolium repens]